MHAAETLVVSRGAQAVSRFALLFNLCRETILAPRFRVNLETAESRKLRIHQQPSSLRKHNALHFDVLTTQKVFFEVHVFTRDPPIPTERIARATAWFLSDFS